MPLASHGSAQRAALLVPLARFALCQVAAGRAFELTSPRRVLDGYNKTAASFHARSAYFEREIGRLPAPPDAVVHIFGLSGPFLRRRDIPYAHYLDYTYRLALEHNPAEIPFATAASVERWLACERASYDGATRIFAMSATVRKSLVDDYGIDGRKIEVVGAGGNLPPSSGPKTFGSRQLLFNASDFHRKGGDLVLEAFAAMRAADPALRLVTVGRPLPASAGPRDGVQERGAISRDAMRALLDESDLVLAPARSDPFPGFVIEASESGTPCIVTDRDGMPEIVQDGTTGIVLHDPTPALIAEVSLALLADRPRLERLSDGARGRAAARFNWAAVAAAMEPFFMGANVTA